MVKTKQGRENHEKRESHEIPRVREGKMESNDFLHFVLFVSFVVPSVFNPDPPAKFPPFLFS
jgi:hypothetical protein